MVNWNSIHACMHFWISTQFTDSQLCNFTHTHAHTHRRTGLLAFGPSDRVSGIAKSLASGEVAHEVLSAQEANQRYPQLQLPDTHICVYEEEGGILNAQRAVMAFQVQWMMYICLN